jgi:hypothetical protein
MKIEKLSILALTAMLLASLPVAYFSTAPRYKFRHSDESALVVSFKHAGKKVRVCTPDELANYLLGVRNLKHTGIVGANCGSRKRHSVGLSVVVDGRTILVKELKGSGWSGDGAVFIFEKFFLSPSAHRVEISMRDDGENGRPHKYDDVVRFEPGKMVVIDFNGSVFVPHI